MNLFEDEAVKLYIQNAIVDGLKFSEKLEKEDIKKILERTVKELESHPNSPIFSREGPSKEKDDIYSVLVEDVQANIIMSIVYQPGSMHFNMLTDMEYLSPQDKSIIFHSVLNAVGVVMDSGLAGNVIPANQDLVLITEQERTIEDCWVMP